MPRIPNSHPRPRFPLLALAALHAFAGCGGAQAGGSASGSSAPASGATSSPPHASPPATTASPFGDGGSPDGGGAGGAAALPAASAIPPDLPRDLDLLVPASSTCRAKSCPLPGLFAAPPGDPRSPVAAWTHDLDGDGSTLVTPRDDEIDLLGVVVAGSAALTPAEGGGPTPLSTWSAFRAPGAGVRLAAAGGRARLVLVTVTQGEPIVSSAERARKEGAKRAWKKRPAAVAVVDLVASPDLAWGRGAFHARLAFAEPGTRASLGVLLASRDASVPQHQHDTSWEVLTVLRGEGSLRLARTPGASDLIDVPLREGAIAYVPAAAQHAYLPAGTRPLVGVQVYAPPGPEQRFKTLAAAER